MTKRLLQLVKTKEFKQLLKLYKVKRIAIFGSYARGEERRNSDIDFLVEFEKKADLLDQVGLRQDLRELFRKNVDVVTPRSLSVYIRPRILKEAIYL